MSESARDLVVSLSLNSGNFSQNIKSVNAQIKEAQAAFLSAGAGITGFDQSVSGMRAGISALESKLRLQKQAVDQYAGALQAAEAKLMAASDKQKQLTAAQTAARQKCDELKTKVAAADQQYNAFKNTLGATDSATVAVKQNLDALGAEYAAAQADVKKLDGQVTSNGKSMRRSADEVTRLSTGLKNAEASVKETTAALKQQQSQLQTAQSAWTKAGAAAEAFSQKCAAVSPKLAAAGRTMTRYITTPILALGAAAIKASVDYESAFADVRKTVDATEGEYDTLSASIKRMSTEVGTVPEEIAKVVANAGQLGIAKENLIDFTRTMIDLGNSTDIAADEAAVTIAQYANVTGMAQGDIGRFGSALVDLGNNFATTESSVMNMASRIGAAGSQVGLTQAQILGFSTGLASVGLEAQAGGTAFSKAMIAMQVAAETGNDQLKDFARVTGVTAQAFQSLWKESPAEAIQQFIVGLSKMDEQGVSSIATLEEMGFSEARLRDTLLRATNASDLFARAQTTASASWHQNSALTEEAGKRYATTEYQLKSLKNTAVMFGQQIGDDLKPAFRELADGASDLLAKFGEMDATQRLDLIKGAGIAAAVGPALLIFGKLTSGVGKVTGAFGKFSTAVGTAGGGVKGLMSVVGKSPLTWIALTAAVVASGKALYDYASGAKEAREALEGMQETARTWGGHTAQTMYNGEGLSFFGLDAESFAAGAGTTAREIEGWADTVIASWKAGQNRLRWNFATQSYDKSNMQEMLELYKTATAGTRGAVESRTGIDAQARKDLEALDALDQQIEKLMSKRGKSQYTDAEIKDFERLITQREAITVKYKLEAETGAGYENILKGVEKEVARAFARGEAGAPVKVYEEAILASAQGLKAINEQLDTEYDKQYDLIGLMADGAEKDAARAALDAKYAADRQAAYDRYAATLKQVIAPVVEKAGFKESEQAMTDLLAKLREYGAAGGDVKPALLTSLNEFVAGMDEDAIVEYTALLGQLKALTRDGGMTSGEMQAMFPDLNIDALLGQIAEIEQFLLNRPEGLEGLNKLFADLGKEVEKIMIDLDMTKAADTWGQFAENPGAVTAKVEKYDDTGAQVPQPVTTAMITEFKDRTADGANPRGMDFEAWITGWSNREGVSAESLIAALTAHVIKYEDDGLRDALLDYVIAYIKKYDDTDAGKDALLAQMIGTITEYGDESARSMLLKELKGYIGRYVDDDAHKEELLADLDATIQAYRDDDAGKEELLSALIGKITAYTDSDADKAALLSSLIGIITGYTDTEARSALLKGLVGEIVEYDDTGAKTPKPQITIRVNYEYGEAEKEEAATALDTARKGISVAFGEDPAQNDLFNNIKNAAAASSEGMVNFYMSYYNRFATKKQAAVWDKIVADLESAYDFDKVLEGKDNPLAKSGWSKLYAAYELLFGDAGANPEKYARDPLDIAKEALEKQPPKGFFDVFMDKSGKGIMELVAGYYASYRNASGNLFFTKEQQQKNVSNAISDAVKSFGAEDMENMLSFLTNYAAAVENGAEISDEAKASFTEIVGFIEALKVTGADNGENILASIVESLQALGADTSVETLVEDLRTLTQAMPEEVSGAAKGLPDELRKIAENAMSSWTAGIVGGTDSVVGAIANAARAGVAAAKSALIIASPSRVFRDQIGRMTMRGFAQGVTMESREQARVIRNAARYLTGEAAGGAGVAPVTADRRTYDQSSTVTVTGNTFTVRDEQDIRALAVELASLTRRRQRGRGVRMA